MRITKVRRKPEEVSIEYERPNPHNRDLTDTIKFRCEEEPKSSFDSALQALKEFLLDICELPKKYGNTLTMTGVTVSYAKNGSRKIVLTGQKNLVSSKSPLNLATPIRSTSAESEDADPDYLLSDDASKALHAFIKEVEAYINGDRVSALPESQPDLDEAVKGDESEETAESAENEEE